MVDCPECGRPLKKSGRKSKYCCENSDCSVIFVRYPYTPSLVEIIRKADTNSSVAEQTA